MPIFRCTEKLRRAMTLGARDLAQEEPPPGPVEWYCNLLFLDRRKCLLFTHPQTLFSFLVACVTKPDFQRFGDMFRGQLGAALATEGLDPTSCLSPLVHGPDAFAKATDRSTLGSMLDHQLNLKFYVEHDGGWGRADPAALTRRLNDTPMGMRGHKHLQFPREVVRQWLRAAGVSGVSDSAPPRHTDETT
jgi:hypothetical protein